MSKAKKSVLEALVGGGDSDDDVSSEEEDEEDLSEKQPKGSITLEDLKRAGLRDAPSVLLMKAPEEDGANFSNW